jgi:hypothetical protein
MGFRRPEKGLERVCNSLDMEVMEVISQKVILPFPRETGCSTPFCLSLRYLSDASCQHISPSESRPNKIQ